MPDAPYSMDYVVRDGVKATPEVSDKDIRIGPCKVKLQGSILDVMVNGASLLTIKSGVSCNVDWSGVTWWNITADSDGKGVHRVYTHPAARTKDGKDCKVESDVRVMPNGEIELTVFNPDPEPKRGCTRFKVVTPVAIWHDQWVAINGSAPFRIPSTSREWTLTPFPKDTKMNMHVYPDSSSFMFFKPDGKTPRFGFRFGENAGGGCIQRGDAKQVYLDFRVKDPTKPVKVYVDLGDTRVSREKPRLVGGVNFREENDFDVAYWDEQENVLVNGGFESGARYFRFESGYEVTNAAHSGSCALRPLGQFYSVGVVLKPNTWYTYSGWIRSLTGRRAALGAPWIFSVLKDPGFRAPNRAAILDLVTEFVTDVAAEKGEVVGIRESRGRAAFFLRGFRGAARVRDRLNHAETLGAFTAILSELYAENAD